MLGYGREELSRLTLTDLLLPEDRADAQEGTRAMLAGERTTYSAESRYRRRDGEVVWLNLVASLERSGAGEPEYFNSVFVEITARKEMEEALRGSDEKFRHLADNITDAFWIRSPDLREVRYISRGFERIWGRTRESLQTYPHQWTDFILPEDRERVQVAFAELTRDTPSLDLEYCILRPDGERRWIRARGFQVRDAEGTLICLTGIVTDITERRLAEVARERLAAIVEATSDLVSINDPAGHLIYLNGAGRHLLGVPADEDLTNTAWTDFLPDAANHPTSTEGFPTAGQLGIWSGETVLLSRRGDEIPVSQVILAHKGANGEIESFSTVMRDVSERKKSEEANAARQVAERANRAKNEFLSRMSHELRTPMNAILGFAQVLELEEGLSRDQRSSVDHILRGGAHLLTLINEVLDIASIEAGSLTLSPELIPLPELLNETVGLLRTLASESAVQIVVLLPDSTDCQISADRQRLKQVLLNLLGNAIKYNRRGGSVTVAYHALEGLPARCRLSVTDTGVGLSAEKLTRLFQPFERLGAERTQVEGTGLGLVLAKRMVESMGGVLGTESVVGQGSTFWVELPAEKPGAEEREITRESVPVSIPELPAEGRAILYIEEDVADLRLIACILAGRPTIRLRSAETGTRAVAMAQEHPPDLIVIGRGVPPSELAEVLTLLAAGPGTAGVPVVIVTTDGTSETPSHTLATHTCGFPTRTSDVRAFLTRIDEILSPSIE
ncbi:MAG: putative two-component system sensor protein [Chthoniobacter sp.]|nr:putative two-component system sensor protein [Chthoniobacter sp.]